MTTTEQLREYLDAHGIDGASTEPGWYAVEFRDGETGVVFCDGCGNWSGSGAAQCVEVDLVDGKMAAVTRDRARRCGQFYGSDFARHAPLTLATPAGRDLDAEVVAGVQAATARAHRQSVACQACHGSGCRDMECRVANGRPVHTCDSDDRCKTCGGLGRYAVGCVSCAM